MTTSKRTAYVLTHHWVANFGANLQALGTRRALEARGIDVKYVDFRPKELIEKYRRDIPEVQHSAHDTFVAQQLPLTEQIYNQAEFEALCARQPADIYVSGSDAVFRVNPDSNRADYVFPNPYWLTGINAPDGASPIKMALAPSAMGTVFRSMSEDACTGMGAALDDFTALSVRDNWTRMQVLSVAPELDPEIVPDPVFLLRDQIRKYAQEAPADPYVVVTTGGAMSEKWVRKFTKIAERNGHRTLAIPNPEGNPDAGASDVVDGAIPPMEWLKVLAGSSGYVGVRFHPVVVSLINGIPVVSLDMYHERRKDRGRSKSWLLMNEFGNAHCCYGRKWHHCLSPGRAWRQLQSQRKTITARKKVADSFVVRIENYLDRAIGPKI